MKKITLTLALVVFLAISPTRFASASIIVDPAQLSAKISEWVQKINDSVNKVTQQVNQIKMMATQGFNMNALRDLAGKYLPKDIKGQAMGKLKGVVEGTQKREEEKKKKEQELKSAGIKEAFDQKTEAVSKDIDVINNKLKTLQDIYNQKKKECEDLKNQYYKAEDENKEIKLEALEKGLSELEELENDITDVGKMLTDMNKQKENISTSKQEAVQESEAESKTEEEALKNSKSSEELKDDAANVSQNEWDSDNSSKIELDENLYKEILSRYFYDPDVLAKKKDASGKTGSIVLYQSEIDRINRERRMLIINMAAHLLQVATTTRREIPVRTKAIEDMFKQTPSSSGELEAISSYAATRIENAKVLMLYAKLQAAKLQYMAAHDLINTEMRKEVTKEIKRGKVYKEFDLGHYILTTEELKSQIQQANKTKEIKAIDGK